MDKETFYFKKAELIKAIRKDSEMGLIEANKIASKVIWFLEDYYEQSLTIKNKEG